MAAAAAASKPGFRPPMSDSPLSHRRSLGRLLRFAGAHWRLALAQLALAVLGTGLILVFPQVVQLALDETLPRRDSAGLARICGLAALAFLAREVLAGLRTRLNGRFEQRLIQDLRRRLHARITRLPLGWFDRQSTGDLLTRLGEDVPATQRVVLEGIEQGLTSVLQILLCAAVMFATNAEFALLALLPTPFIAAGGWLFARWVAPRAREARAAASRLQTQMHDTLTGIRQIKGYTAEAARQRDFEAESDRLREAQNRLTQAWSVYSPLMGFLGSLGLVLLLGLGGQGVLAGRISTGELFQFIFLLGFFFEPIARLHGVNQTLVTGLASAGRVFQILDETGEEDLDGGRPLPAIRGAIAFEQVSFGYAAGRPVLRGLDLQVAAHQTAAIVGASGAGKSTLFQLLARFYEPQQGRITLDGEALADCRRSDLRAAIAYVTQDAFLFAGSIRDNLRLGRADAGEGELWNALRLAGAEDFVRALPEGLDAEVGERGVRLSGGERQRLAMARAFLKDAPILLLDEATSAVDTKSEQLIQTALETLRRNRTCLVIAHRLSTVVSADVIYVLHQGRVLAHGRHDELVQSCPYYRELANLALL